MSSLDSVQVVFIAMSSGFGSAVGAELARYLVTVIKEKREDSKND